MVMIRRLTDFPGYGVSQDGRVWTKKLRGRGAANGGEKEHWTVLYTFLSDGPGHYLKAKLRKDNKTVGKYVHRLVYEAWVGPLEKGFQVNHIDGNKLNNAVSNLEKVTRLENMQHAYATGLGPTKENGKWRGRGPEELTQDQKQIIRLVYGKIPVHRLAKAFGVSYSTIYYVMKV